MPPVGFEPTISAGQQPLGPARVPLHRANSVLIVRLVKGCVPHSQFIKYIWQHHSALLCHFDCKVPQFTLLQHFQILCIFSPFTKLISQDTINMIPHKEQWNASTWPCTESASSRGESSTFALPGDAAIPHWLISMRSVENESKCTWPNMSAFSKASS
jgi:hypothetical protein